MSIYEELMKKDRSELVEELEQTIRDNKVYHDVAVYMGENGLSPSYYNEYMNTIKTIKKHSKD